MIFWDLARSTHLHHPHRSNIHWYLVTTLRGKTRVLIVIILRQTFRATQVPTLVIVKAQEPVLLHFWRSWNASHKYHIMNLGTNYSGPHVRTPMKTANIRKKWLLTGWLLGEFIACVQNHFVFETCVSRCKIRISPDGGFFKLLGHRWYMPPAFRVCWECLKITYAYIIHIYIL